MGFLNVTLMQIPRVYYSMAEDRTLPAVFQKVNPKTQTQEFGLLFLGAIILVSIFLLRTFENIVNYVMFLDTMTLAIVSSSIFFLRRKARPPARPTPATASPSTPSCRSSSSSSCWPSP